MIAHKTLAALRQLPGCGMQDNAFGIPRPHTRAYMSPGCNACLMRLYQAIAIEVEHRVLAETARARATALEEGTPA